METDSNQNLSEQLAPNSSDLMIIDEAEIANSSVSDFISPRGHKLLEVQKTVIDDIDSINIAIQKLDFRMSVISLQLEKLKEKKSEKPKKDRLKVKPIQHFVAPYFRDAQKFYPPMNHVTIEKNYRNDFNAYWSLAVPWGTAERKVFLKIVNTVAMESVLAPHFRSIKFLGDKLENDVVEEVQREEIEKKIEDLKEQVQSFKFEQVENVLNHPNCKLDWLYIAGKMENVAFSRSPDACEKLWTNLLDPKINRKKFTKAEDEKLVQLVLEYEEENWKVIAEELNTNRTAVQCITRFQSHLNKTRINKYWTPEEDEKLINVVESVRIGEYIPWYRVLSFMDGRSLLQLQNRWDRCLKPQKRDCNWDIREDAILLLAVAVIGSPQWAKISCLLHGRTSYYCRERYTNNLDPELITGAWAAKDDKELLMCVARIGEKWGKISREFPSRTDNMVNNRCKIIRRYKPKLYKEILQKGVNFDWNKLPKSQLAPSKMCNDINAERDRSRQNAFMIAKTAAQKVLGYKIDFSGCKKFKDFASIMNEASLELVAEELCPNHTEELTRPKLKYSTNNSSGHYNSSDDEDDEDSDDEITLSSDEDDEDLGITSDSEGEEKREKIIKSESKLPVISKTFNLTKFLEEFDKRLLPNALIGFKNTIKEINLRSRKRGMEYGYCVAYLFKMFHLDPPSEFIVDEKNGNYYGVDYAQIIPYIMDMFVMANSGEPSLPVIPVNLVTLKGIKVLFLVTGYLCNWAGNLDPTSYRIYNSFASRASNGQIMCPVCEEKLEKGTYRENSVEENITDTEKGKIVKKDDASNCVCEENKKVREQWILFINRMAVVFAWPLLAASTMPSRSQISNLILKPMRQQAEMIQKSASKKRKARETYSEPEDDGMC